MTVKYLTTQIRDISNFMLEINILRDNQTLNEKVFIDEFYKDIITVYHSRLETLSKKLFEENIK